MKNKKDMKKKENTPDDPCVLVPYDFILGFEKIIEKLEASRHKFGEVAAEMKSREYLGTV